MSNQRAILISAILAGVAMLMVYSYVADKEDAIKKEFGEEVVVLIANQNIQELTTITPDMITEASVPKKYLQPNYIIPAEREGLFIDTQTVASAPIYKGEQVLKTKLLFQGPQTGISSQVSMGKRAISISINDVIAVNRLIKPGDRVDVITNVLVREGNTQINEVFTSIQDVLVLAVGDLVQRDIPRELGLDPVSQQPTIEDLRKRKDFTTITLELDPDQAQKMVWLTTSGNSTIYLSLRNSNDRRITDLPKTVEADVKRSSGRALSGGV